MPREVTRRAAFVAVAALVASAVVPPVVQRAASSPAERPVPQKMTVPADVVQQPVSADSFSVTRHPVRWPLDSADADLTDGFGPRDAPTEGASTWHLGQDFAVPQGTPIHAALSGVVTTAGDDGGYGFCVVIASVLDGVPIETVAGHMVGQPLVVVGQQVTLGQVVGYVGSTGVSTGPHLHFEVHVNGAPVDPLAWLRGHVT